jgi:pimeloyl-ACP methyl ester carboxylesterase
VYAGVDQAVASRLERGLPPAAARLLVERNVNTSEQGVSWSTDPRLHAASAVKLTVAQIEAVLGALSMPTLLLLSKQSSAYLADMVERAQEHISDLTVQFVEGGHHFHMESDVNTVAQSICQFLSTIRNSQTA